MIVDAHLHFWNLTFARGVFSASRMTFGGDWPVATFAGDYTQVITETTRAIADYSPEEQAHIWYKTAVKFYKLNA